MWTVCEVFNLFSDCIPQEGLNRMERGDADRLKFLISKLEVMVVKVMCCASSSLSTHANHGIPVTLGQEMKSGQLKGVLKG